MVAKVSRVTTPLPGLPGHLNTIWHGFYKVFFPVFKFSSTLCRCLQGPITFRMPNIRRCFCLPVQISLAVFKVNLSGLDLLANSWKISQSRAEPMPSPWVWIGSFTPVMRTKLLQWNFTSTANNDTLWTIMNPTTCQYLLAGNGSVDSTPAKEWILQTVKGDNSRVA